MNVIERNRREREDFVFSSATITESMLYRGTIIEDSFDIYVADTITSLEESTMSSLRKTGSTSLPIQHNGASSSSSSSGSIAATPSRSKEPRGVASNLLLSLEQSDHVTETDHALISQFTSQEVRDLRMVFDVFDKDKKGYIDAFDLRRALRVIGFKLSHDQVDVALGDIGRVRIGEVTFKDFLELVAHRQGDSRDIYAEIHQGFDLMDYGKKGCLTALDLKMVAKEVGVKVNDVMIREMVEEASSSGDSTISRDEFIAVMLQTNMYKD